MQHNHSHRAAPPHWSNLSGACQVSHLSHHPTHLTPFGNATPALLSDPASSSRRAGERGAGGREGHTKEKETKRDTCFPPGRLHQSQRATLTHPVTHMSSCLLFFFGFKNEMKMTREQVSEDASLLCPRRTSPIVKGYW